MYRRKVKVIDMNEFDVTFSAFVLISMDMEPLQIKAELQVAHDKIDKAMADWKRNTKKVLSNPPFDYVLKQDGD